MVRFLGFTIALLFSLSLSAQQKNSATAEPKAGLCTNDIKRFCANVQPSGGRIHTCLGQNKEKLSKNCRASYEMRDKPKQQPATQAAVQRPAQRVVQKGPVQQGTAQQRPVPQKSVQQKSVQRPAVPTGVPKKLPSKVAAKAPAAKKAEARKPASSKKPTKYGSKQKGGR
ncbi:hypothetical protein D3C87_410830 [compost metagenome]